MSSTPVTDKTPTPGSPVSMGSKDGFTSVNITETDLISKPSLKQNDSSSGSSLTVDIPHKSEEAASPITEAGSSVFSAPPSSNITLTLTTIVGDACNAFLAQPLSNGALLVTGFNIFFTVVSFCTPFLTIGDSSSGWAIGSFPKIAGMMATLFLMMLAMFLILMVPSIKGQKLGSVGQISVLLFSFVILVFQITAIVLMADLKGVGSSLGAAFGLNIFCLILTLFSGSLVGFMYYKDLKEGKKQANEIEI